MVEAMGLKCMVLRSIQWYDHSTEFHKNLLICSEVNGEGEHTDGKTEL
jgi:hypothetical protein